MSFDNTQNLPSRNSPPKSRKGKGAKQREKDKFRERKNAEFDEFRRRTLAHFFDRDTHSFDYFDVMRAYINRYNTHISPPTVSKIDLKYAVIDLDTCNNVKCTDDSAVFETECHVNSEYSYSHTDYDDFEQHEDYRFAQNCYSDEIPRSPECYPVESTSSAETTADDAPTCSFVTDSSSEVTVQELPATENPQSKVIVPVVDDVMTFKRVAPRWSARSTPVVTINMNQVKSRDGLTVIIYSPPGTGKTECLSNVSLECRRYISDTDDCEWEYGKVIVTNKFHLLQQYSKCLRIAFMLPRAVWNHRVRSKCSDWRPTWYDEMKEFITNLESVIIIRTMNWFDDDLRFSGT